MQFILALAGLGKRLWPITESRPKCMVPVLNRPILAWIIDELQNVQGKVIVVVPPMYKDALEQYIRERLPAAQFVVQEVPRGTADIVITAASLLDPTDDVFVIYGDVLFPPGTIKKMADINGYLVAVFPVADPRLYGVVKLEQGKITEIIEKPTSPPTNLSLTGLFKLPGTVVEYAKKTSPSARGELELTDTMQQLINNGVVIGTYQLEWWFDIGTPWTLLDANAHMLNIIDGPEFNGILKTSYFKNATIEDGVVAKGKVIVGENTVIRSGTYIIGPVYIGKNCDIGPHAYIRPYTVIGDGVRVGNSCEIKASILMNEAAVPHLSYIGDSIIGERVNLGGGTITANVRLDNGTIKSVIKGELVDTGRRKLGAVVGDNVKTGINVNIMPGVKIGNNCMIGPGINVWRDVPSGSICITQKELDELVKWNR